VLQIMPSTLKFAIRSLLRQPSISLTAIATLALGIACATVVFSSVNAALVRPLPYPDADNIYSLRTVFTDGRFTSGLVAPAELFGLAGATDDVIGAVAGLGQDMTLHTDAGAFEIRSYSASRGFLELFGAQFHLGRGFTAGEHERGGVGTVVLSYGAWQRYFGSDPAIAGKSVQIADRGMEVVGVTAPAFELFDGTEAWLSSHINPESISHLYDAFIRVRPGTSIAALEGPMSRVMQDLAANHPDQNKNRAFSATPLLTAILGDLGPVLLIVLSATGLLLAIAVVNVASLLLTRSVSRAREMAVRSALGAGRGRLIGQLLTESSILAGIGTVVGVALAWLGVRIFSAMGSSSLPRLADVEFDGSVLLFVAGTLAATALGIGGAPALLVSRSSMISAMNEGGRAALGGRANRRILVGMVVAQIAVGVVLVDGAGRLIHSYDNLTQQDRGFTSASRLVVDVNLPRDRYPDPAHRQGWLADARSRMLTLGITRVAAATLFPLRGERDRMTFVDLVKEPSTDPHSRPTARMRVISPEFLDAMGITQLAGRSFTAGDRDSAQTVVIVSQTFVEKFLAGRNPVIEEVTIPGISRMTYVDGRPQFQPIQIVGVAADVRYASLAAEPEPSIYLPLAQSPMPEWRLSLVAEAKERDVETLGADVRATLADLDAAVPVAITTLAEVVNNSLGRQRIGMVMMSVFGAAAIMLVGVGVFGVIAFLVSQRTGEIAVRLALGATQRNVYWLVMRRGGSMVAVGLAVGLLLAWWTGAAMSQYVYLVSPFEPIVNVGSTTGVIGAALLATELLARRASKVSPCRALRG
jgi:putative ABC transport system permease protein